MIKVSVQRRSIIVLMLIMATFGLAACQSMSSVRPGDGRKATIAGKSYDEIWSAAHKVCDEHFEIREQDKTRGVIIGERETHWTDAPAWVGTYITPPTPGAPAYTIEVVRRKKMVTNVNVRDWEYKILRDIYRELGLPALDPSRDP
jgi:hypothetical protein